MMLRNGRSVAIVALAALFGASPAPVAQPGAGSATAGPDAAYAALAKAYFDENFRANPVGATAAGVHAYDAQLGSYAAADYAAQAARDHRYLDRLAGLDPAAMSPRIRLDRRMLENALRDDLLLNATMQQWKHQPDGYVQTASGGVFGLISRAFAPPAVRMRAVVAREEQIPRLFAQARANLTAVDKDTAAIAAEDAAGSVELFTKTVPQALAGVGDAATRARFRRSTAAAVAATSAFANYLKTRWVAHPAGTYAIGAANYSARLKYEEGIDMPLTAISRSARRRSRRRMPRWWRRQSRSTRTQPPSRCSRAVQGASHVGSPGPLERVATKAFYNVTPVNPHDPPNVQAQYLESFNDFERPIVSAHEVYPGHFVNFAIDRHLPLTLSEKLLTATSFVEGWAHYDEQMMVDEGWGNGDPRVKIMQLREAIWRNARYVAGVKMHTQGMTVSQATAFFRSHFLDPANARAEARRGTQDATYGYYTLGKLEILKLRDDYEKKLGSAYTLARFHHDLLQYGDPALPLLRPLLLGADDDGKILPGE